MRRTIWIAAFLLLGAGMPILARAQHDRDALTLIAPDALGALVVEKLREHSRTILESELVRRLGELPAVRGWLEAEGFRRFEESRKSFESGLGVSWDRLRDDVLGDTVVLSLHTGPDRSLATARGVLLTRIRDAELVRSLASRINAGETADGTLREVISRTHEGMAYSVRRFRDPARPEEAYAILDDRWFVWSNSSELVVQLIGRYREQESGLAGDPRMQRVRAALPERAVARLYLAHALFADTARSIQADHPEGDAGASLLADVLPAVEMAGLALEWADGFVLHVHEELSPDRLKPMLGAAGDHAAESDRASVDLRMPEGGQLVAVAALRYDAVRVVNWLTRLLPKERREDLATFEVVAQGLLLGLSPRDKVLPALGSTLRAYVFMPGGETESGESTPEVVLSQSVSGPLDDPRGVPAALSNAMRTILALSALDRGKGAETPRPRLASTMAGGAVVTALAGGESRLAFAVRAGELVVGNSAGAAERYLNVVESGSRDSAPLMGLDRVDGQSSFVAVDLEALVRLARAHRKLLDLGGKATGGTARQDVEHVLALLERFRFAFATHSVAPDGASAHQTIGLLARPSKVQSNAGR